MTTISDATEGKQKPYHVKRERWKDGYHTVLYDKNTNARLGSSRYHGNKNEDAKSILIRYHHRIEAISMNKEEWIKNNWYGRSKVEYTNENKRFPFEYVVEVTSKTDDGDIINKIITVIGESPYTKSDLTKAIKELYIDYHTGLVKKWKLLRLYHKSF
jgi:hypothetical protein